MADKFPIIQMSATPNHQSRHTTRVKSLTHTKNVVFPMFLLFYFQPNFFLGAEWFVGGTNRHGNW
jgi:hypothetical protein